MICRSCHRDNRAGRKFCGACGGNLEPVCGGCGFVNEADDRFCGGCGASMSNLPGVAPITPPVAAPAAHAAPALPYAVVAAYPPPAFAPPAPYAPPPYATAAAHPGSQVLPTLPAPPPPQAARTTQAMPWPADELAGLFAPPAPVATERPGAKLPELGIAQDDLDRLFESES